MRRTTFELPVNLWCQTKNEATNRGLTLRGLIVDPLRAELAKKPGQ